MAYSSRCSNEINQALVIAILKWHREKTQKKAPLHAEEISSLIETIVKTLDEGDLVIMKMAKEHKDGCQ